MAAKFCKSRNEPLWSFSLDLFNIIRNKLSESNLFISPLSIMNALSMTLLGAKNNTEKQMVEVMKIKGMDLQKWHKEFGILLDSFAEPSSSGKSPMNLANKIFVDKKIEILTSFIDLLKNYYKSEHGEVNFQNDSKGALHTINDWVKEKTKGKIPKLLEDLDPLTTLVLVNAVYFKGTWQNVFDKNTVKEEMFYVNERNVMTVKMMSICLKVEYMKNEDATAIKLPFNEKDHSMYFILPNKRCALLELEDKLLSDFSLLEKFLKSYHRIKVDIFIPRFTMKCHMNLTEQLSNLGMSDLFNDHHCDLSGMTGDTSLAVSAVIHEATLEVNEEGAVATAATAVKARKKTGLSFSGKSNPKFYADHPFLVLICHEKTVTFIGHVMQPESN